MGDALDDDLEVSPHERLAARRALHTLLRYWIACPTRRCRRWRRCAGDLDRCHALFWPVVPPEIKEWWRAVGQARRDGCSARQAARLGDAAARRCRSILALQAPRANDDARCAVRDAGSLPSPASGYDIRTSQAWTGAVPRAPSLPPRSGGEDGAAPKRSEDAAPGGGLLDHAPNRQMFPPPPTGSSEAVRVDSEMRESRSRKRGEGNAGAALSPRMRSV